VSDAHQALECRHRVVQVIGDLHHSRESIAQMAILGVFGPRVLDDILELLLLLCGERERERERETRESERLASDTGNTHSLTFIARDSLDWHDEVRLLIESMRLGKHLLFLTTTTTTTNEADNTSERDGANK